MSHKFLPAILLVCVLLACPTLAQTGAAPNPAAPAGADTLTPDQAKRALETLQDDAKRAQIIDTLRAIARISPDKASAPATPPAPEPQRAIPLTADSLGAQLLLTVSEQLGDRLVLRRPDRQPPVVGGGDDRDRSTGGGGDLGSQQRADGSPAQRVVA